MMVWNLFPLPPAVVRLWFVDCRRGSGAERAGPGRAVLRSGVPRAVGSTPGLRWAPPCSSVCLVRWVAELVAVQKLVVFFRKKASSF